MIICGKRTERSGKREMLTELSGTEDFEPPGTTPVPGDDGDDDEARRRIRRLTIQEVSPVPKFPRGRRTSKFAREFFPAAGQAEWNDWRWQLAHRITSIHSLRRILDLSQDEANAASGLMGRIPLAITPYFASLLERANPNQGLRRAPVPVTAEFTPSPGRNRGSTGRRA